MHLLCIDKTMFAVKGVNGAPGRNGRQAAFKHRTFDAGARFP
jgi:hypothetical protein